MSLGPTERGQKTGGHAEPGRTRPGLFYGWWIALGGCLGAALMSATGISGFGVFFPFLEAEFGWSRAAFSGALSVSFAEAGLLGPVEGALVDRWGPRRTVVFGVTLMAVGFLLFSRINSLLAFYLVLLLGVILGQGLAVHVPMTVALANWFRRKRGLAFAVYRAGFGIGGFAIPLLGALLLAVGWRNTAVLLGIVAMAVGYPLAYIVRLRPEDRGALPDGDSPGHARPRGAASAAPGQWPAEPVLTVGMALRARGFWLLGIAVGLRVLVTSAVLLHFVVMVADRGLSVSTASFLFGVLLVTSIPGRLLFGLLGDTLDRRLLMVGAMGVLGVSTLVMSQAADMRVFVPATLVYALMFGGLAASEDALRADFFGRHSFGTIMGFNRTLQTLGAVSGPVAAGAIYDATQSYELALLGFAVVAFIGMACLLAARPPRSMAPAA